MPNQALGSLHNLAITANKNLHMDCFQRSFFVQARYAHIIAQKNYAESNQ